jgi:putative membrane protein
VSYLTDHWSFSPFLVLAVVLAGWHEIGLFRLARRSGPEGTRSRWLRSLWFYAGLVVVLLAVESPVNYWGYDYFFVHMIQHLLLMFAAPSLIVAGAPWQPLRDALPVRAGASRGGADGADGAGPLRVLGGLVLRPWVSIGIFSAVMICWHLPGPYDLADRNQAVHTWLMEGSFLVAGVLFWLQFIPSPPFRRRMPLLSQAAALLVTNVVMIVLAMALSIFASHSVYPVYAHIPGVTLPPFADQQIGAAILWVCGDFWAVPTMIAIVRQMVAVDGSVSGALETILHRGHALAGWGGSRVPRSGPLAELRAQPPSPPDAGP